MLRQKISRFGHYKKKLIFSGHVLPCVAFMFNGRRVLCDNCFLSEICDDFLLVFASWTFRECSGLIMYVVCFYDYPIDDGVCYVRYVGLSSTGTLALF